MLYFGTFVILRDTFFVFFESRFIMTDREWTLTQVPFPSIVNAFILLFQYKHIVPDPHHSVPRH